MSQTNLVVDDEPQIVRLVRAYLEEAGFRVVTASDGQEALYVARHEKPDLIVLDILMPRMDGLEFTRRIRRERDVPIIMLTARAPVGGGDEISQLATAFNRMAESLARAETARRNQTADIAHELRTPLTVLRGTLEAMLDGVYPTDRENLQAALAQVQTLSRLVEDLRLLALADAGQLVLHPAPVDIAAFLRDTVEAHRPAAQERGVRLEVEPAPDLPPVLADRDRLAQVLGNLISNGLRYVPAGGRVTVRAVPEGETVVVTVADDGPGIPADDLPHIFERFWRGDRARRRATGGSGLGLAIARSLVEAHGGRIWVTSTEGEGTAFSFAIPVARGE